LLRVVHDTASLLWIVILLIDSTELLISAT
jgi:hypothetical protein